jgi:hypothetical protein
MDLSKLPKLSDTRAAGGPVPGEPDRPMDPTPVEPLPAPVAYRHPATVGPPGIGADIWISTIVGLLFLSLGFTFARFLGAKLAGHPFHTNINWQTGPLTGQEVAYFDLEGYTAWMEMGVFLFGVTLLVEAVSKTAIALRPGIVTRTLLMLAMALTAVTIGLNLYACMLLQKIGLTPIMSGLAVAFGGWVLYDEYQTLKAYRRPVPVFE